MMDDASQFRETPLVEQVATILGFDAVSKSLPGPRIYPPFLFLGTLLVIDFGLVNTIIHYTTGYHILVTTPTAIAAVPGLFLAVVGIRSMTDGYARAIARLELSDRKIRNELAAFERITSRRSKLVVYVLGVVLLTAHVGFNMSSWIISIAGLPGLIYRVLIWNTYLLFVVEFALLYFGVHVVVPRRLEAADVGLFYYDPEDMGGFGPLGQLLKRSYYLYTAGLLLLLVISFGPVYLASIDPSFGVSSTVSSGVAPTTTAFFTIAWVVGVLSIAFSMLTIHRLMAKNKQQHIAALEEELREVIEDPYEITTAEKADDERLNDIERRLERIRATRVYPASFTMWSQIAVSVIFPQALQLLFQATG